MFLGQALAKQIRRCPKADSRLVDSDAQLGIEIELRGWNGTDPAGKEFNSFWEGKRDDSLRSSGREFITIGGLSGKHLVDALDVFYATARAHKWGDGYPYAGIHVHMDVTDLDESQFSSLLQLYLVMEHAFFSFAGDYRRYCGFCYALTETKEYIKYAPDILFGANYDYLVNYVHPTNGRISRYQALNLSSLSKYGTLEFRHLPTTMDQERLMTWINMILALRLAAIDGSGGTSKGLSNNPLFKELYDPNVAEQVSLDLAVLCLGTAKPSGDLLVQTKEHQDIIYRGEGLGEILKAKVPKSKPKKKDVFLPREELSPVVLDYLDRIRNTHSLARPFARDQIRHYHSGQVDILSAVHLLPPGYLSADFPAPWGAGPPWGEGDPSELMRPRPGQPPPRPRPPRPTFEEEVARVAPVRRARMNGIAAAVRNA